MKATLLIVFLSTITVFSSAQSVQRFDILSCSSPTGFTIKEKTKRVVLEKKDGHSFCQLQLWPAQQATRDPKANFKTDWDYFAGNQYKIGDPKEKQT